MNPKISVIIPVYNGAAFVEQAIQSVFDQTYPEIELILVDDGSTDNSWDILLRYGGKLKAVHKENGGVSSALNLGIRESTGEYIAWLSHDDLFMSEKISRQVNFFQENPTLRVCYTDFGFIDASGKQIAGIRAPWYPRIEMVKALFRRNFVMGSTILIHRTCFEEVGYFAEDLRYTSDLEMWLRLLSAYEFGHVPEILGFERVHPGQQGVKNVEKFTLEAQKMYTQVFESYGIGGLFPEKAAIASLPRTRAWADCWLGDALKLHQGWHEGWYHFAETQYQKALQDDPSWRNPARIKLLNNHLLRFLDPLRTTYEKVVRSR